MIVWLGFMVNHVLMVVDHGQKNGLMALLMADQMADHLPFFVEKLQYKNGSLNHII